MRKNIITTLLLLLCSTAGCLAQQMPNVEQDKAVRQGKLANGLTYYIRQNGYPEHRVNFYIAHRVGSLQEEDDQRGLAHFLEHMAFNGSNNFPGSRLLDFTRSHGIGFGSDLNAYTSIDKTVYRISNVPSGSEAVLDSCLLVLKDWSNGLTLASDEIDKERGVIHEEWRLRTSAEMRMLDRNLQQLYPGSKYGERMPIGKMEVIDNFKPDFLRAYYKKWYHPLNQAVIIVGDVDPDKMEAKIKATLSDIQTPENPAKVERVDVPDNTEPIVIVDKDKEQKFSIVEIMMKHEAFPDEMKPSLAYFMQDLVSGVTCQMLNKRLEEKAQEPDCPFVQASVEDGEYIFSRTMDALTLTVIPKEGKALEAVKAVYREALRAKRGGFQATEMQRVKDDMLSQWEQMNENRLKTDNSYFGNQMTDHFLENEPIMAIEDNYQMLQQFSPMLPVDIMNQYIAELVQENDTNLVVMSFNQDKEGVILPQKEALLEALHSVRGEEIAAYVDNVKTEPLMSEMPKKGKITSSKDSKKFGYKELSLSNGARVLLKHTDFKEGEVLFSASSVGGSCLYGEQDFANVALFPVFVNSSGLGNFSNKDLEKALAGKNANVSLSLGLQHETVDGSAAPKDLETLLQLNYLYFTNISKDEKNVESVRQMLYTMLKNKSLSPETAFQDSLSVTRMMHNKRFASMDTVALKNASYDRILEMARERYQNAGDFTFTIIGNYDEAKINDWIETYIASLPSNAKKDIAKPMKTYAKGSVENSFKRKMETPKATAVMIWSNQTEKYSLEGSLKAQLLADVLEMDYLQRIREDEGAAYSVAAYSIGGATLDNPYTAVYAYCPMKPEKADICLKIMREAMLQASQKTNQDYLTKAKEVLLKNYDTDIKTNEYWQEAISTLDEYGIDISTDYKAIINRLTAEDIAAFAKNVILKEGNALTVVMMPE